MVQQAAHPEAHIIFGASIDEELDDEMRVVVIATGFDNVPNSAVGTSPVVPKQQNNATQSPYNNARDNAANNQQAEPEKSAESVDPYEQILRIFNHGKTL